MPISLTRAAARAISRLPMFAHATNHTSSNPAEMADAAANGPTESDRPGREANSVPVTMTPRGLMPSGSTNSRLK